MNNRFFSSLNNTKKNIFQTIPLALGVLLLISLLDSIFELSSLANLFYKNILVDSLVGGSVGSLAAGNPITSYVLAGEFLQSGISLAAVTAFILTWVTVGLVQLPAESMMLGKKFAVTRNALSFLSAILIGLIVQIILI